MKVTKILKEGLGIPNLIKPFIKPLVDVLYSAYKSIDPKDLIRMPNQQRITLEIYSEDLKEHFKNIKSPVNFYPKIEFNLVKLGPENFNKTKIDFGGFVNTGNIKITKNEVEEVFFDLNISMYFDGIPDISKNLFDERLRTVINHELVHVYEAYKRKIENKRVFNSSHLINNLVNFLNEQDLDEIIKEIGKVLYLGLYFEVNAFKSQIWGYLMSKKDIVTKENIGQIIKDSFVYDITVNTLESFSAEKIEKELKENQFKKPSIWDIMNHIPKRIDENEFKMFLKTLNEYVIEGIKMMNKEFGTNYKPVRIFSSHNDPKKLLEKLEKLSKKRAQKIKIGMYKVGSEFLKDIEEKNYED